MKQLNPAGRKARSTAWCSLLAAAALLAGRAAQAQVEGTAAPLAAAADDIGSMALDTGSLTGGEPRFALRLVKNSGAHAATGGWWWLHGKTASTIDSCTAQNRLLIDVDS